jgi:hypothetical protein
MSKCEENIEPTEIELNKAEWEGKIHIVAYFSETEDTRLFTFALFVYRDGEIYDEFMGSLSNTNLHGDNSPAIPEIPPSLKEEIGEELSGIVEEGFEHIESEGRKLVNFPNLAHHC